MNNNLTTEDAKKITQKYGCDGVIVIAVTGRKFATASYGRDRELCGYMGAASDVICDLIRSGKIVIKPEQSTIKKPVRRKKLRLEAPREVDYRDAIEQAERIIGMAAGLPDAGSDFGESVAEKCRSIIDWINDRGEVTRSQEESLDNMENGISRWFHD